MGVRKVLDALGRTNIGRGVKGRAAWREDHWARTASGGGVNGR